MSVRSVDFLTHARTQYRSYARHVLGFRHFAEGRDGLMPVQRRVLWTMRSLSATSPGTAAKTSKIAGYTAGNFHPHGDGSVAGSAANMTQANQRYPLLIGVGNFGGHDAQPAAPRYTSAYLSPYALTMLEPSELAQVPMDQSYDGKNQEPRYLPASLPHLLVQGLQSLAPGYVGYVPPCEPGWILEAISAVSRRRPPSAPRRFAYRWGGALVELEADWVRTGQARARFAPTVVREERRVLITTLAPGLWLRAIGSLLARSEHFGSLSEETAESNELVRLVCLPRRGGSVAALAEHAERVLVGRTQSYSFLSIAQFEGERGVDYRPMVEGPSTYLARWLRWRVGLVAGAATHRADAHRADAQRLLLYVRAIEARARLLPALDQARDRADLRTRVRAILRCSEDEAQAVVEMQLHRLAFMNINDLRARAAAHERERKRELAVAARPHPRAMQDAERTVALLETLRERMASERHVVRRRRGARRS